VTLPLTLLAALFMVATAVPLGLYAATITAVSATT